MGKPIKRVDNKGRKLPDGFSQRVDGRYQARFTFNGRRYTLYDKNLISLKAKLVEKQNELNNGIYSEKQNIILNQWFENWLKVFKEGKIKKQTYDNYKNYWKWYIADTLGKSQVKNVKRIQIVALYNDLLYDEKKLSLGTVKYVNNLIASVFKQAVYNDIISKDPSKDALKEFLKETQHKVDALAIEEQSLFFKIVRERKFYLRYKPMFTVSFGSGVRIGELTALTWEDIDFENETISIDKTLHYVKYLTEAGHHYNITTPKTYSSIRTIPMLGEVKKALYDQKQYQETFNIKGNIDVDGYSDFVFTTMRRTPYTPDGVNTLLSRIVSSYNKEEMNKSLEEKIEPILLRNFSTHVTRHSFSTRCYECGMDAKAVQEILGHKNIKTTLNIYTDCSIDVKRKQLHLMERTVIS